MSYAKGQLLIWRYYEDDILSHWSRVTHICVNKLTIIGPDNGLSPGRRQAIIWTNAGILLIGPLGTNFSEILIIQENAFQNVVWKMAAILSRPQCVMKIKTITVTIDSLHPPPPSKWATTLKSICERKSEWIWTNYVSQMSSSVYRFVLPCVRIIWCRPILLNSIKRAATTSIQYRRGWHSL